MQSTEKKVREPGVKSRKKMIITIAVIVVVLLIGLVVLFACLNRNTKDAGGLYTSYEMTVESGDSDATVFYMSFDKSAKTYEETLGVGDESVSLGKGTYEEKDGTLTLTSDEDKTIQSFAVQGKYLVATDYLYDGEIPDGDTFEVKCSYINENDAEYSITFREDGTYTLDSNGDVTEGTYKRDGDFIKRTDDSAAGSIDYLIYKNQITNSYYVAE